MKWLTWRKHTFKLGMECIYPVPGLLQGLGQRWGINMGTWHWSDYPKCLGVSNNNPSVPLPARQSQHYIRTTVIYWLIRKLVPEPVIRNVTALYKCTLITAHSLARVSFENMCIFPINGHGCFFKIDIAFSVWKKNLKISCWKNPALDTHLPSILEQHLLGK